MKDFSKDSAKAWLDARIRGLISNSSGITKAWLYAAEHLPDQGDQTPWRDWIIGAISDTKGQAHTNPAGLLLSILADGPRKLPSQPTAKHTMPRCNQTAEEASEHKARAVAARTTRPAPGPPMALVLPLSKRLGFKAAWAKINSEWIAQGRPYPDDFDSSTINPTQELEPQES